MKNSRWSTIRAVGRDVFFAAAAAGLAACASSDSEEDPSTGAGAAISANDPLASAIVAACRQELASPPESSKVTDEQLLFVCAPADATSHKSAAKACILTGTVSGFFSDSAARVVLFQQPTATGFTRYEGKVAANGSLDAFTLGQQTGGTWLWGLAGSSNQSSENFDFDGEKLHYTAVDSTPGEKSTTHLDYDCVPTP
jgi:hypothetical protein